MTLLEYTLFSCVMTVMPLGSSSYEIKLKKLTSIVLIYKINPFLPDCKTTFSWIFYIFYAILKLLRPEHDFYAKFTSCST